MSASTVPVEFQVLGEKLVASDGKPGEWITVSRHTRDEIDSIEARRLHYPASRFQTRWVERITGRNKTTFKVVTI